MNVFMYTSLVENMYANRYIPYPKVSRKFNVNSEIPSLPSNKCSIHILND